MLYSKPSEFKATESQRGIMLVYGFVIKKTRGDLYNWECSHHQLLATHKDKISTKLEFALFSQIVHTI